MGGMKVLRAVVPAVMIVLASCGNKADEGTSSGASGNTETTTAPTVEMSLVTAPFEIQPGQELFKCFYTTLSNDTEAAVARFESTMSRGSHHMILFGLDKPGAPDGTLGDCNLRQSASGAIPLPLYVAQEEHQEATFPSGVAMPLKPRQAVAVQMHYLNAGAAPVKAQVDIKLHALAAGSTFERAGVFASFHNKISVPARGTQTVTGRCQVPPDVKFVSLTTHSHRYTTRAVAGRTSPAENSVPQMLVETLDYERPMITKFPSPFLDLEGDKIFYSCEYRNDTDQTVTVGDSAVNEEMCMAVGYYFPANGITVCLGSTSIPL